MITRTMDAAFLNEVVNDPAVRPFLGGPGGAGDMSFLDLTEAAQNPANYLIEGEHGGWLFHPILPSVYELHTMFLPKGRGRRFFAAAHEVLRYMFTETDCLEVVTKCPDDNGPARMAAGIMGFRERFRRDAAWSPEVGISYQVFSVDDWCARDAECLEAGHRFHDMLEEAKAAAGSPLTTHADDEAHDRAVGAASLMILAGNMAKGVAFYNRWSIFAGYATIEVLSPTLVDVRDAIVEVRNGQMGVIKCRLEQPLP